MFSCPSPCDFHAFSYPCPCVSPMVTYPCPRDFLWFPINVLVIFLRSSCQFPCNFLRFPIKLAVISYVFLSVPLRFPYIFLSMSLWFPMVFHQCSCDFLRVPIGLFEISYGFQFLSLWFPTVSYQFLLKASKHATDLYFDWQAREITSHTKVNQGLGKSPYE